MPTEYRKLTTKHPGDLMRQFKSLGNIGPNGEEVFAEVLALEALSIGGGGAGTPNYTEGDIDSTITGVAMMWEDAGDTLRSISAAFPLPVSVPGTIPVTGPLTDTQLRASAVSVTDTRLPAALDADGGVKAHIQNFPASQAVTGTFWQATQPVSGPLTDTQLRATPVPVSGPLTDTQLRATPVPVSGTVSIGNSPTVDTELPTAAALSDTTANPTAPMVGAGNMLWDTGITNWVRWRGDAANGARVNILNSVTLPVNDNGLSLSVDDNGGTLTVDPNAGTVWDTSDRAARELGRARIWDGTDEATVLPVRTQPATTEKAVVVQTLPTRMPTYQGVTAEIAPAITIGVKELLAIWHDSTKTKDMYITNITVSILVTTASTTGGRTNVRVSKITTAPTGGTAVTTADIAGAGGTGDYTNFMAVKTGGGALGTTFIRQGVEHATEPLGNKRINVFQATSLEDAIILRSGVNDGISIDCERVVAHTALVDQWTVEVRWLEL